MTTMMNKRLAVARLPRLCSVLLYSLTPPGNKGEGGGGQGEHQLPSQYFLMLT